MHPSINSISGAPSHGPPQRKVCCPQSGIQCPAVGPTSYCPARVTPIPRQASSHGLAFAQQAPRPGVPFPLWPGETLCLTFAPTPLPASPEAAWAASVSQPTLFPEETAFTLPL